MDPITQAILLSVTGNLATEALKAAYAALKNALTEKFGKDSDLVDSVDKLEKTPDRDDRKTTVQTEIKIAKANQDPYLVELANNLLNMQKEQPGGSQVLNQVVNNVRFSAFSGTGNATLNIHGDKVPSGNEE